MRVFIAIDIPDEIRQQMAEVQAGLRKADVDASWPRPEGIHLTLRFLGEVPESRVPAIAEALREAARTTKPFRLEIGDPGAFPNVRSARVVWMGVSGETEKLNRLQGAVEDAMAGIGMEREQRAFKPHLTLARIKHIRSRESLTAALGQVKDLKLPGFEVAAVSLMKSELKRTGAEYAEVARIELR